MDCACIEVDIDEGAEWSRSKMCVARKEHLCGECRISIKPGEKYEYYVGKYDGELSVQKTCLNCLSVRDAFFCSWYWGRLWDELENHIAYLLGTECLAKNLLECTPLARERISKMIEDQFED